METMAIEGDRTMAKTLTLRLEDDADLQTCMRVLGEKTASKTITRVLHNYLQLLDQSAEDRQIIDKLRQDLEVSQQTIEGARSAAALLLEACGQSDLGV